MARVEAIEGMLRMLGAAGLVSDRALSAEEADARVMVFADALSDISDEAVLGAARVWLRTSKYWPTPADLRAIVKPPALALAERSSDAERCYAKIVRAYESGMSLGFRQIRDADGYAAAVAFMAAGGDAAFAWCEPGRDQEFRHKRFVEEFAEQAEGIEAGDMASEAEKYRIPQAEAAALLRGSTLVKEIK